MSSCLESFIGFSPLNLKSLSINGLQRTIHIMTGTDSFNSLTDSLTLHHHHFILPYGVFHLFLIILFLIHYGLTDSLVQNRSSSRSVQFSSETMFMYFFWNCVITNSVHDTNDMSIFLIFLHFNTLLTSVTPKRPSFQIIP